jgi:hypothetical protein
MHCVDPPEAIPLRNIKAKTIIKVLTISFLLLWVFLKQLSQIRDPMLCLIYFRKLCPYHTTVSF